MLEVVGRQAPYAETGYRRAYSVARRSRRARHRYGPQESSNERLEHLHTTSAETLPGSGSLFPGHKRRRGGTGTHPRSDSQLPA